MGSVYILKVGFTTIALKSNRGLQTVLDVLSKGTFVTDSVASYPTRYFKDKHQKDVRLEIASDENVHLDRTEPEVIDPAVPIAAKLLAHRNPRLANGQRLLLEHDRK
jgi:hypothetical protein